MGIFSRSSNLEATKSALEKAQAKRDALRARAQAAVDALLAAGIAIDTAQVAAVEAVERGEQPQSIEKLKAALREAQHVEQASAKALSFAENQLQDAELAHQRAVNADARDRQRAQAARTLEALRLLAAEHGKGQAIETAHPGLPRLAIGIDLPMLVQNFEAHIQRETNPPPPPEPADGFSVRFIKSYPGRGLLPGTVSIAPFAAGERAGFPSAVAKALIASGYAEAV